MAARDRTPDLIELGDVDELVRHIDRLVDERDWDGVAELRARCAGALQRGKQLWPAATHAEYRLALQAPARWAASVLEPGAGRFALAPLTEVAASSHGWGELAPFLDGRGPIAAVVAQERAVRGDRIDPSSLDGLARAACEVPLELQGWEPAYVLPTLKAHTIDDGAPDAPWDLAPHPRPLRDQPPRQTEAARALAAVAGTWAKESNGRVVAVEVDGARIDAVAAIELGVIRMVGIEPAEGMRWLAWAASTGGAYGRRPGAAAGRVSAWWAAAALADLLDDWPVHPDDLGDAITELQWSLWDDGSTATGWSLRLAVDDPVHGLAWAVSARDERSGETLAI